MRTCQPSKSQASAQWLAVLAWSISVPHPEPPASQVHVPHPGPPASQASSLQVWNGVSSSSERAARNVVEKGGDGDKDDEMWVEEESGASTEQAEQEQEVSSKAGDHAETHAELSHVLAERLAALVGARRGRLARLMDTPVALQMATAIEALGSAGWLDNTHTPSQSGNAPSSTQSGTVGISSSSHSSSDSSRDNSSPRLLLQGLPVRCSTAVHDTPSSSDSMGVSPLGSVERLAVSAC